MSDYPGAGGNSSTSDGPLIIVDFDGVINVPASYRVMQELRANHGWRLREVLLDAGPEMVFYNPRVGGWLRRLAEWTGAELAWGTLRREWANNASPLLYLPDLPVAPVRLDDPKAVHVVPWTRSRPFAWFDDLADECQLAGELAGDQPHLMVKVDPRTGLTLPDVQAAGRWLERLPGAGRHCERGRVLLTELLLPVMRGRRSREKKMRDKHQVPGSYHPAGGVYRPQQPPVAEADAPDFMQYAAMQLRQVITGIDARAESIAAPGNGGRATAEWAQEVRDARLAVADRFIALAQIQYDIPDDGGDPGDEDDDYARR